MKEFIQELVYPNTIRLPVEYDVYAQLLERVQQHELHAQVYTLLNQSDRLLETPDFFQYRLKEKYEETLFLNFFIKNQTDSLLQYCEANQLEVIPLKGVYFAEKVFGHFGARATSDIDLLIHIEDLEEVIEGIREQGFIEDEPEIDGHFHSSFSKKLPWSEITLTVELHWTIVKEDTTNLNVEELWREAYPFKQFKFVKDLSDHHMLYFMILHGWRHNLDSYRHYLDIVQVIKCLGSSVQYERLLEDAKRHGTLRRVIRTLTIVYNEFPFLDQVKSFPHRRRWGQWQKGEEELSSEKRPLGQYLDFIDYHLTSYDKPVHGVKALMDWFKTEKMTKKAP